MHYLMLILFVLLALPAYAQEPDLPVLKDRVETVLDMWEEGLVTESQAQHAIEHYLDQSGLTLTELMAVEEVVSEREPTFLQRAAGFITFVNVVWVFAGILGVVCLVVLLAHLELPAEMYEIGLYLGSFAMMFAGTTLETGVAEYVGFTGAVLFAGALATSNGVHRLEGGSWLSLVLGGVTGVVAMVYESSLIGALSVFGFVGFLGFAVWFGGLVYAIGFKDEDAVARATAAVFPPLLLYVAAEATTKDLGMISVFEPGVLYICTFVGYLGLLIMSSKWYASGGTYAVMQVVTLVAGVFAIGIGTIFAVPVLAKMGGTFFVLWAIEKAFEIPVNSVIGYCLIGLGVAASLWGLSWFTKANPDLLAPYLFLLG